MSNNRITPWLLPLSWLYGVGVDIRNKLFDWHILPSRSFDVPTICVGNLAVGGTGKTPHTEYLIKLLHSLGLHVATLSRGYKRKSKGYILAGSQSTAEEIGDEPLQMKQKFPDVRVAVCADRSQGIEELLKIEQPAVDVVLLDDAYQHRYVKAGLNILLTDYNRLLCDDALLPAGRLREPIQGKDRAQIMIVTKCPDTLKPIDFNIITRKLSLYPYQQLYFSRFKYGSLEPLFPEYSTPSDKTNVLQGDEEVVLVTGIASPAPLLEEVKRQVGNVKLLAYPDHHSFEEKDFRQIEKEFQKLSGKRRLIITTEKDAARLKGNPELMAELKPFIHVLPIEIEILLNQQQIFNQNIIGYVRKNPRNRSFSQREDAHTT